DAVPILFLDIELLEILAIGRGIRVLFNDGGRTGKRDGGGILASIERHRDLLRPAISVVIDAAEAERDGGWDGGDLGAQGGLESAVRRYSGGAKEGRDGRGIIRSSEGEAAEAGSDAGGFRKGDGEEPAITIGVRLLLIDRIGCEGRHDGRGSYGQCHVQRDGA